MHGRCATDARGDVGGMVKGLFSTFKSATTNSNAAEYTRQTRSSGADVVMLSGCKDSQTSADAMEAGRATGAMSWAFTTVLRQYPQMSYLQLLNATRYVSLELIKRFAGRQVLPKTADERVAPHRHEFAVCDLSLDSAVVGDWPHLSGCVGGPRVAGRGCPRLFLSALATTGDSHDGLEFGRIRLCIV